MQASLFRLQMCDEDVARLRLDPDLALRCDAGRCSSQAATAWSLADEAIGRYLPKAYMDFNALELMEGISLAATIVSMCFTYTPAHVEDMLQGAVNDLVVGAWKAWYFVDPATARVFKRLLQNKYGPDGLQRVFQKQPRSATLSAADMRHAGVRIIFQPPGFMMVTLPVRSSPSGSQVECPFLSDLVAMNLAKASTIFGHLGVLSPDNSRVAHVQGEVFHWTISLGASIAESLNFFTTAGSTSLACLWSAWQRHAQEAASTHGRDDVAGRLADALTSFGVLSRSI